MKIKYNHALDLPLALSFANLNNLFQSAAV